MTPDPATHAHPSVVRAKRNARLIYRAIVVVAAFVIAALVLVLLPYRGMEVYSFEPTVTRLCTAELLGIRRDYEIFENAEVWEVEVRPYWEAIEVEGFPRGARLYDPEVHYTESELRPGRRSVTGAVIRAAPAPGLWRVGAETTPRGTPYIIPFPKSHLLNLRTTETVRVLGSDDPTCDEGGRE